MSYSIIATIFLLGADEEISRAIIKLVERISRPLPGGGHVIGESTIGVHGCFWLDRITGQSWMMQRQETFRDCRNQRNPGACAHLMNIVVSQGVSVSLIGKCKIPVWIYELWREKIEMSCINCHEKRVV